MVDRVRVDSSTRRLVRCAVVGIVLIYTAAVGATIATKLPICDEGWYGQPAFRLAAGESMSTPALETAGTQRQGLDRHTYWVMPLFIVAQAGVYKIAGAGLLQMRSVSALCGLLLIFSWYSILRKFTEDPWVPVLAAAIMAVDVQIISVTATGRSDAMCAALGSAGLAVYLCLRKQHLTSGLFLGHSLVAASGLTHPCGIYYFIALLFLMIHFDRKEVGWRQAGTTLVPYAVAGAVWGIYILKAPADFLAQFGSNAAARAWVLTHPAGALLAEVSRYRKAYGFDAASTGASHFKVLILAAYVCGVAGGLLVRPLRQDHAIRLILILTGLFFFDLILLEGAKQPWYLIHLIPGLACLLACWFFYLYRGSRLKARLATVGLCGFLLLSIAATSGMSVRKNYQNHYEPLVAFLHRAGPDGAMVIGGAELGFGLGFDRVKDDFRLGFYSGRRPEWIVVDGNYRAEFQIFKTREPDISAYVERLLTREYFKAFNDGYYTVYSLRQQTSITSDAALPSAAVHQGPTRHDPSARTVQPVAAGPYSPGTDLLWNDNSSNLNLPPGGSLLRD